jgi:hypothetical protein
MWTDLFARLYLELKRSGVYIVVDGIKSRIIDTTTLEDTESKDATPFLPVSGNSRLTLDFTEHDSEVIENVISLHA